jgi:hypothetical protein
VVSGSACRAGRADRGGALAAWSKAVCECVGAEREREREREREQEHEDHSECSSGQRQRRRIERPSMRSFPRRSQTRIGPWRENHERAHTCLPPALAGPPPQTTALRGVSKENVFVIFLNSGALHAHKMREPLNGAMRLTKRLAVGAPRDERLNHQVAKRARKLSHL